MFSFLSKDKGPVVLKRPDHCISRRNISRSALRVLYTLSDAGYKAYLVGGGVRDLLMGREPKDFDVATDARPEEIKRLFRRCFLVGKRFRLAHVVFGRTVIETSTFRRQPPQNEGDSGLYQSEDNCFGTPEEDALRRDFTINGLFYDIKTFDVIDYVGGLKDLKKGVLRSIGNPEVRFQEDPVRMMRAIRLSSKLGLKLDRAAHKAICRHANEIENASAARVLEEIFRLFSFSSSSSSFRLTWETGLLKPLLPVVSKYVDAHGKGKCDIWKYLSAYDELTSRLPEEEISNGLRIAALYLAPFLSAIKEYGGNPSRGERQEIAETTIARMDSRYQVPKAAYLHASRLLRNLDMFKAPPPKSRPPRISNRADFLDAIILAKVNAAVNGGNAKIISAWEKLLPKEW